MYSIVNVGLLELEPCLIIGCAVGSADEGEKEGARETVGMTE